MCCSVENAQSHERSLPRPLRASLPATCLVHMLPGRPCLASGQEDTGRKSQYNSLNWKTLEHPTSSFTSQRGWNKQPRGLWSGTVQMCLIPHRDYYLEEWSSQSRFLEDNHKLKLERTTPQNLLSPAHGWAS